MKQVYLILVALAISFQTPEAITEIEDVTNKKFILTRTDDVFLFDKFAYLFHVTNLTRIYTTYEGIRNKYSYFTIEEHIWIKKIDIFIYIKIYFVCHQIKRLAYKYKYYKIYQLKL